MPKPTFTHVAIPNRWIAFASDDTVKLTYSPQVNPSPLTVSLDKQNATLASLQIVITNETPDNLSLTSIAFEFPVGDQAALTFDTSSIKSNLSSDFWQIQGPGKVTCGTATVTLSSQTSTPINFPAGSTLILELYQIQTITEPSATTISITETYADGSDGYSSFGLTTFPDSFYFNSLSANIPNGSTFTPIAQVPANTPITLLWNGSASVVESYTIYQSSPTGQLPGVNPAKLGEWTSQPITDDTVFTICITAKVEGGTPLVASLSVAVAVQNAQPVLGSASIIGDLAVKGHTQLTNLNAAAITGTSLSAGSGPVQAGSVNSSGNVQAGSFSTSGNFSSGAATLASATVNGNTNLNGLLALGGNLQAMQQPIALMSGTSNGTQKFSYKTDAIVIAVVQSTGNAPYHQGGAIVISYGPISASTTGMNMGEANTFLAGSMVLPVPANTQFSISFVQFWDYAPAYAAYFLPLGNP